MGLRIPENPPYELDMDPPGYIADRLNWEVEAVVEKYRMVAYVHNSVRLSVTLDKADSEGE
jgi:hypothetical protein